MVLGNDGHIFVTPLWEEPDSKLIAVPVEAFSHEWDHIVPNPPGLYHFEYLNVVVVVGEVNDHKSFKNVLAVLLLVVGLDEFFYFKPHFLPVNQISRRYHQKLLADLSLFRFFNELYFVGDYSA